MDEVVADPRSQAFLKGKKAEIDRLKRQLRQSEFVQAEQKRRRQIRKQYGSGHADESVFREIPAKRRKRGAHGRHDEVLETQRTAMSQDSIVGYQEAYNITGKTQFDRVKRWEEEQGREAFDRKVYKMKRRSLEDIKVPFALKSLVRTRYIEDFIINDQDQKHNLERFLIRLQP